MGRCSKKRFILGDTDVKSLIKSINIYFKYGVAIDNNYNTNKCYKNKTKSQTIQICFYDI